METRPMIGRIVWYRSKTGDYTVPATINCTADTLYHPAVEAGYIPALTGPRRVHLTVMSPGLPQVGPNGSSVPNFELPPGAISHNLSGTYQEWDIPFFEKPEGSKVSRYPGKLIAGVKDNLVDQEPGTWTWPEYE